jgi:hypothetical protein
MKGGSIVAVSAVVARGGQDLNKMTARKIWDLPLLYFLLDVMCSVHRVHILVEMKQGQCICPERKLCGLNPNFYIYISVSDLYIPTIGLPFSLQENKHFWGRKTDEI